MFLFEMSYQKPIQLKHDQSRNFLDQIGEYMGKECPIDKKSVQFSHDKSLYGCFIWNLALSKEDQ